MLDKDNIYFLGIGGIGMSAIARYFLQSGKSVYGYDKVKNAQCEALMALGAEISFDLDKASFPKKLKPANTTVIYTPAIAEDNDLFVYIKSKKFELIKRAGVLGLLAQKYQCLAIAGTHGKTTTSALLAHLFTSAGRKVHAFLGGVATNYNSNYLHGEADELLIAEADEFDRSFLTLHPSGAVITSTDADHLDIYGDANSLLKTFGDFANSVQNHLYVNEGVDIKAKTYGFNSSSDFFADHIRIEAHQYVFDLSTPTGTIEQIKTGLPGRHNVENAVAAAALALAYGLSEEAVKAGIESFKGVKRRFEYHIKQEKLIYIDDYAHHPSEIEALIGSVRELYPNRKISGVFQPHLFSRTQDFMDGFASSLSMLDELLLMEIYPAREKPIPGIHAGALLEKVRIEQKTRASQQEILAHFDANKPEVVLTIGAGDIDQLIQPLKLCLLNG
jgi:UDP-N-acetylmuramate--alanine ligase